MTPTFGERARLQRALLALTDPAGETDAVAPLKPEDAYAAIRRWNGRPGPSTGRRGDPSALLAALGAEPGRTSGRVPCPAHGGTDRNLAWRLTDDGRVLLTCHSHQCAFGDILRAVLP